MASFRSILSKSAEIPSFNAFFTRQLKPDIRNFSQDRNCISSPVDGEISQVGSIKTGKIFQAKGRFFSLLEFLGGEKDLEKKCLHSSKREEIATKAERASIKFMQVKYMSTKIGRVFSGIISGINDRGLFVETEESKAEGFIQIKNVPGDYFVYNEKEMLLIGRHTKEEYRLGDSIKIKVDGVNEIKNHINYTLLEKT